MNIIQAVILGIVQGLTEFLPVSSSGHLVIGQKLLGFSDPPVLFDILAHLGTLLAVLVFFKKQIFKSFARIFGIIIVGTLPAVLAGLFLNHYIEAIFNSLTGVGVSLIITSILLFSTKLIKKTSKDINQITWQDALLVGIFQALAILPGVSRSGSTVVSGLWRGLKRETAFIFSFYLAVPAILGALVLQMPDLIISTNGELFLGIIGMMFSAFFGYLSLKILEKVVLKGNLFYFGFYCLVLGIIILAV